MKCLIGILLLVAVAFSMPSGGHGFTDPLGIVRKCTNHSECGVQRCCLFKKFCFIKLPKYIPCSSSNSLNCGCGDGLECTVTKKIEVFGIGFTLKQCMPPTEKPQVEELGDIDQLHKRSIGTMEKRFLTDSLPITKCAQESECGSGQCCAFSKICAPKLPKYMTCGYLQNKHKCGCVEGTECKEVIFGEILGKEIKLNMCMPIEE